MPLRETTETHKSLEKGLLVLKAFLPENRAMGTVELARRLEIHRSTISRLLGVLKTHGLVLQNPETRKYSLGQTVADLATAYRRSFQSTFTELARPYLERLRNDAGQTVVLEIPSGDRSVLTYVAEGLGPIKIRGRVGDRHHYHTSAGGKAILAFSPAEVIEQVLGSDLPRLTPKTVVDSDSLGKQLEEIRKRGFAFDNESNNIGINAFGMPVLDRNGTALAAVVIAGGSHLVTWSKRNHFVPMLQRAVQKITARIE